LAVRWYLRYALSYRDLEELLAERGIEVDHLTPYRWVQRFTPSLIDAARLGSATGRGPLVRRRDLRRGLRGLVLRLPGGRPAWPGDRRVRVTTSPGLFASTQRATKQSVVLVIADGPDYGVFPYPNGRLPTGSWPRRRGWKPRRPWSRGCPGRNANGSFGRSTAVGEALPCASAACLPTRSTSGRSATSSAASRLTSISY
jgi:hypothetical protein